MGSLLRTMRRASGEWSRKPDAWKASGSKPKPISRKVAGQRVSRILKRRKG